MLEFSSTVLSAPSLYHMHKDRNETKYVEVNRKSQISWILWKCVFSWKAVSFMECVVAMKSWIRLRYTLAVCAVCVWQMDLACILRLTSSHSRMLTSMLSSHTAKVALARTHLLAFADTVIERESRFCEFNFFYSWILLNFKNAHWILFWNSALWIYSESESAAVHSFHSTVVST